MTQPQANIAVIGAGIAGLSTAYALSQSGHNVTLYDPKGFPADDNASAIAGGMLAPYAEIEHMPPEFIEAGLAGIQHWEHFAQNHDIGFHRGGSLLIAHEEDRYILERFKQHLPAKTAENVAVEALEPQLADQFTTGLHLTAEAHLDPQPTLFKLCKTKQRAGTKFREKKVAAEDLAATYDHVIDCRGYSAAKDDSDLRGVKGEILIVRNDEFSLSRPVRLMHPRYPLYIVPRDNHIFMIGATNIESADDHVTLRSGLELMSALYSLHSSFGEAQIIELKAGVRPAYPDNLPRITIKGNVISCNGLYRHGFLLSPIIADCVADHIAGIDNKFMTLFKGKPHDRHDQRREKELRSAA